MFKRLIEWLKLQYFPAYPTTDEPVLPITKEAPMSDKVIVLPKPAILTPWMNWMRDRQGWNEDDNAKQLEKYWKYTNVPDYKGVVGAERAWCAMTINAALTESGYKGNHHADAVSFATYGTPCKPTYGAIIVIRHTSGGYHVTFFHSWVDEAKHIGKFFGGNQSNALQISTYTVSGNAHGHDEIIASRWPVKA